MKSSCYLLFSILLLQSNIALSAQNYLLKSPDGMINSEIVVGEYVYYSVKYDGKFLLMPSPISKTIDEGKVLGKQAVVIDATTRQVDAEIETVWGLRSTVPDQYNELVISFTDQFSLHFRVYNDGVAYRWETHFRNKIKIVSENSEFRLDGWPNGWFSESHSTYETQYNLKQVWDLSTTEHHYLPAVINTSAGIKMALIESDVHDYPSMHIKKNTGLNNDLVMDFDRFPLQTQKGGFNNYIEAVTERADYIAYTNGSRLFPWRILIIAPNDAVLADNDMVYKLARPLELSETDWIKPGLVMWDWWADYVIDGVDFETGINTPTYLYLVDFAAQWGIPYINVDWRWSDGQDLFNINPFVDIKKIVDYARSKGVKVIVWSPAFTLDRQLEPALDMLASWGVAGVKVDFFDRWDQLANQMYERIAIACAEREMLVNFHGSYLPTGLHRAYPNIINYEGVLGNEANKFKNTVTPKHKATLPFIRSLGGPMDFTPGGMRNVVGGNFPIRGTLPYTQGTRANEMALYVVYYESLKMLADAPTEYAREPEIIDFLTKIPTVWDESKVLEARLAEYLIVARKKDNVWYMGGINDDSESREFNLSLSFLDPDKQYRIKLYYDGANTNKNGRDHRFKEMDVNTASDLMITMNEAGGFVARIEEK